MYHGPQMVESGQSDFPPPQAAAFLLDPSSRSTILEGSAHVLHTFISSYAQALLSFCGLVSFFVALVFVSACRLPKEASERPPQLSASLSPLLHSPYRKSLSNLYPLDG